jgi:hypothetical protein
MKCLKTEKFLKMAQNQGVSKKSLLNKLYKEITPLTQGFFHDTSWEPIRKIYAKIDEILIPLGGKLITIGSHYDNDFPPKYKTWNFEIEFNNQKGKGDTIYGRIIAAGAASVESPLDRYDLVVTMS